MKTNNLIMFLLITGILSLPACKKVEKEMMVSTGSVSNILTTTADVTGSILDLGEGATNFGHCYSTSPNSSISGSKTDYSSPSTGGFTSALSGLSPATKYYVKAFLKRGNNVVYGDEITFSTASASQPQLTTAEVTGISKTTAVSGGNVTSQGGTPVTIRGVCWSLATNPVVTNFKSIDGEGTGSFSSNLTSLTSGTKYYVRAYAANSGGTAYGNEVNFTTISDIVNMPIVSTANVSLVTSNSASCGGNVTDEGGGVVSVKGVCYNTSANPTILSSTTNNGSGLGAFTSSITGLNPGITYYVRAYASNSAGTSYGTEYNFTTTTVLPSITTVPTSELTGTSVKSGGDITSTGGSTILDKGVCWSLSSNPTILDNVKSEGTGTGTFESTVTGLAPGTAYHLRAYATNSVGTSYVNDVAFSTLVIKPTVTTASISNITTATAAGGGNVTSTGGATVLVKGVCWSISLNPQISDLKTENGSGPGPFTSSITGLIAGTLYHVRAYASNSAGTGYGDDVTFTAGANVPSVTTSAVINITSSTATSGGNVTGDGGSSILARGVCWGTGSNPDILGSKTEDTPGTGAFSSNITGLLPNISYIVRAYATNSAGTGYGSAVPFTTPALLPTVSTTAATSPGCTTGTSGGNITNDGGAAISAKGVCYSTGHNPDILSPKTTDGSGSGLFTSNISGLLPGTTYYIRAYATNIAGTNYGTEVPLTTLSLPSVSTLAAESIGPFGATLKGSVNANGQSTTVTFEYGQTTGYGLAANASQSPVTGTSNTTVSGTIASLTHTTTYNYRVKVVNACGTVYGGNLSFVTTVPSAPTATTSDATGVGQTSATFNGSVNGQGDATTVTFDYGTTTSYGSSVAASPGSVTGSSAVTASPSLSGNTTYHFRVKAVNDGGTTYGLDKSFTTWPNTPTTSAASSILCTSVHLAGTVNAPSVSNSVIFEYGTTTGYGQTKTATPSSVTGTNVAVAADLTGLTIGTLYHFRLKTNNSTGSSYSADRTFTTLTTVSDGESNVYSVVKIGTQLWMKDNLASTKFNDGTSITNITVNESWALPVGIPMYCWYDNSSSSYKATYGALYNWLVVDAGSNGGKNVCPTGWHVPSLTEFTTLTTYLGGLPVAGGKMKEAGISHWFTPNTGADNSSLFTARPGGWRNDSNGTFSNMTYYAYFWTTTPNTTSFAYTIYLSYNAANAYSYSSYSVRKGHSIRCIKD
jgi:uncharacterized protein (TIGR02145 family)